MGSFGSTRWACSSTKVTIESAWSLDINGLNRAGCLRPGYWGGCEWKRDGEQVASIQFRRDGDSFTPVVSGPTARWGMAECRTANSDRLGGVSIRRRPAVFRLSGNRQRNYL